MADVVKTLARRSGHEFVKERTLDLKGIPEPLVAWELTVPSAQGVGVAVIEDHPLYRQGLMQTIEGAPGWDLVAAVGTLKTWRPWATPVSKWSYSISIFLTAPGAPPSPA